MQNSFGTFDLCHGSTGHVFLTPDRTRVFWAANPDDMAFPNQGLAPRAQRVDGKNSVSAIE